MVPPQIELATHLVSLVEDGEKQYTIRKGARDYVLGPAQIGNEAAGYVPITIWSVAYMPLRNVPQDVILGDGFADAADLLRGLREFYPDLQPSDTVTVVYFTRRYL